MPTAADHHGAGPQGGLNQDTISAIATAPGAGGIGVIRLSGPAAHNIAETLTGIALKPRYAHYCAFSDRAGDIIDDGIALAFPGPRSFTGEDVVELQGHGGSLVLQMLLERTFELGARQAEPGEFSERAFLNGRIDLAQAEAIADLIAARTRTAAKAAQASLRGAFSTAVNALATTITSLRVYVEAAIDFPEEEVDFLADGQVAQRLTGLIDQAEQLAREARAGALVQHGAVVVIAGRPNAGKSSLLNRLAGDDIAIVTDIAGTTRDIVREAIQINGIPLTVTDTAGLRDTGDVVEQEGVRRATREIDNADLVIQLIDDTDPRPIDPVAPRDALLTVFNKIDVSGRPAGITADGAEIAISTRTGAGLDALKQQIATTLAGAANTETQFSARERHLTALNDTVSRLKESQSAFLASGAGELLAEDLRDCQQRLGAVTGRISSDELLGEIFSSFCIGK